MIERTDFIKKQMVFFFPMDGDKITFRNDNLVILDKDKTIKSQVTCYRVFLIFVIGDTSITTGIIQRANKYGFSICLMNRNMKMIKFIGARMEGNTLLRKHQYEYDGTELAQHIILNKVRNQRNALCQVRNKNGLMKDAIVKLDGYIVNLQEAIYHGDSLRGIEGTASRVYFAQMFNNINWIGRKPRIKADYINASLDIGYTILFNLIDALINCYGFDEYYGVFHTCFYMRKSLVCDLMEPFRPIIDYTTRKAVNLKQIQEKDFKILNKKYILEWKKSPGYVKLYLSALLEYKNEIFIYIQSFYRAFMKEKNAHEFPVFQYGENGQ